MIYALQKYIEMVCTFEHRKKIDCKLNISLKNFLTLYFKIYLRQTRISQPFLKCMSTFKMKFEKDDLASEENYKIQ